MKGQSFLENVIITGMVLSLVMGLFYFSSDFTFFHYRQQQTDDALQSLLITANAVYELGPGNREDVLVNVPEDVILNVKKKSLTAQDSSGGVNASVNTLYDIVGNLPTESGLLKVPVRTINSTLVKIGKWIYIIYLDKNLVNFTSLPLPIYIGGEDLDTTARLLINGISYPSMPPNIVNSTTVWFTADPNILTTPSNKITTYTVGLRDVNNTKSNTLLLRVRGSLAP